MSLLNESSASLTLGGFCAEASMFELSKESFDLYKEASEITLMDKYLECQEYLLEYGEDEEDRSGLITESADGIDAIYESLEEKKQGFLSKIWNGIKKVINALVTFFGNIIKSWSNAKEVERLRAQAKEIEKISEDDMEKVAMAIKKLRVGKAHAVENMRANAKKKDEEISKLKGRVSELEVVNAKQYAEIERLVERFKGVNQELYRELRKCSMMIAEDVTVKVADPTYQIDDFMREVANVLGAYKDIKNAGKLGVDRQAKNAQAIENLLTKIKNSENRIVTKTINSTYLEDVYRGMVESKKKIDADIAALNKMEAEGKGYKDTISGDMKRATKYAQNGNTNKAEEFRQKYEVRSSGANKYNEMWVSLHKLLDEFMKVANNAISELKGFIDARQNNIRMFEHIVSEIRGVMRTA